MMVSAASPGVIWSCASTNESEPVVAGIGIGVDAGDGMGAGAGVGAVVVQLITIVTTTMSKKKRRPILDCFMGTHLVSI
jgi:hypothetical protein